MVRAGRAEERRRARRARPRRGSAKRSRSFRLAVSTRTSRPVSGSTRDRSGRRRRARPRAGRAARPRGTSCRAASWASRRAVEAGRGSRRRGRRAGRVAQSAEARQRRADGGRAVARLGRFLAKRPGVSCRPRRPCCGASARGAGRRTSTSPRRLPRRRRHVADRASDALGDVGLAAVGGAERHGGRDVEDEPGRQRPLGDVDAHVRLARPRGRVPVDQADVVARRRTAATARARCRRPRVVARSSPGKSASTRRRTARSRARSSASGMGPGPGAGGRAKRAERVMRRIAGEVDRGHATAAITARGSGRA